MFTGSASIQSERKSFSLPSLFHRSLSSAASWANWGASLTVSGVYSAYQYTRGILHYEQSHTQSEDKQAKQALSITEHAIAGGLSGAVKGTVAAAVIYSGASLPVVGLVSLGLLPKNTAVRLGGKVLGASFQVVLNAQHLAGYALSMMHWTIPTNWMQLGLKKGSDAIISFVDSKNLTRLYQDYHVGERIWLWTGTIGSIRNDLRMIPQEYKKTKVTEYQSLEIRGKITDTFQCQNKWLFWDECRIQERHLIEQDLLRNTVRKGILRSEDDGHSWMPVTYEHVSDAESYRAEYENGRVVGESKIPHLPIPKYSRGANDVPGGQPIEMPLFVVQSTAKVLFPLCLAATLLRGGKSTHLVPQLGALSIAMAMPVAGASLFEGPGLFGKALKALFSPADFFIPTDSIERIIKEVREAGEKLTWAVGKDVRLTVGKTGEVLRATIQTMGGEANKFVADFGKEGKLLIEQTVSAFRLTADDVLNKTVDGAEVVLNLAEQSAHAVIKTVGNEARVTVGQVGIEARLTVQETARKVTGVIEKAKNAGDELVINLGKQGRLTIEKFGIESRLTADKTLKTAFKGAQVTLEVAGLQARMLVKEAGLELRSVITHAGKEIRAIAYEIPLLSRLSAESIVEGIFDALKNELFGTTNFRDVMSKMSIYMKGPNPDLKLLLEYVRESNHVTRSEKAQLYIELIRYAHAVKPFDNIPESLISDARRKIILIIGAKALNDSYLFNEVDLYITSYTQDFITPILATIPDDSVRKILASGDENQFLGYFGLLPAPQEEPDGSVPVGTVASFPGHILPRDFVECDGQEYSVADFPDLYAVIEKRYGYRKDEDEKEYFKVPDYRGYFLKGWDHTDSTLGATQQDSTRMPDSPFRVETAEGHSHQINQSGEHEHVVEHGGAHEHTSTPSGDHKHVIDKIKDHSHGISEEGQHSHAISQSGKHTHGMSPEGKHSHELEEWQSVSFTGFPQLKTHYNAGSTSLAKRKPLGDIIHVIENGEHIHPIHDAKDHSHEMDKKGEHQHTIHDSGAHTHGMEASETHTHNISFSETHTHSIKTSGSHEHKLTSSGEHNHTLTGGDKETRPKNINAKFMIKYKPSSQNLHKKIKKLEEELERTRETITEKYRVGLFATTLTTTALITLTDRCIRRLGR